MRLVLGREVEVADEKLVQTFDHSSALEAFPSKTVPPACEAALEQPNVLDGDHRLVGKC